MDFKNIVKVEKSDDEPKDNEKPKFDKKRIPLKLIENCKTCNGNPTLVEFKVLNFCGTRCDTCYLIQNYNRTNQK